MTDENSPLIIYSKPDCHLCDRMKEVVEPVARSLSIPLLEVDITADPVLSARYGWDIPVLCWGQTEVARHRITEREVRDRLRGLTSRRETA